MTAHHVILPVIIPAVLAAVMIFARSDLGLQRLVGIGASLILFGLALFNLGAASTGPIPYFLGNWPAPFGIVLMLDRLSALMLALVAGLALTALIYAVRTGWDARGRHFHALFLFQVMGLNGAFLTADAFNLFVFFEVLLIASYGLLVHSGGAERLRIGMQYVVFNLIGSTVFLFALSVIYAATGTLNMADLAVKLPLIPPEDTAFVRLAAALFFVVFAIKGALVPFAFWLPRAYASAPAPIAALFAVMTKLGAYAMIRFGTLIFAPELGATGSLWAEMLWVGGIASVMVGALGVLSVRQVGTLIGYAIIGSMGVIFMGLSVFSHGALVATLYYLLHSTLAAALLFLLAENIALRKDGRIAALFLVAAMAMIGLPPLSGFLGKIMILQSLSQSAALGWSVILGGALITMIGFARAGSALFWGHAPATQIEPMRGKFPIAALALALVGLTVFAAPVTEWLGVLAADLINPQAYIAVQSLPIVQP